MPLKNLWVPLVRPSPPLSWNPRTICHLEDNASLGLGGLCLSTPLLPLTGYPLPIKKRSSLLGSCAPPQPLHPGTPVPLSLPSPAVPHFLLDTGTHTISPPYSSMSYGGGEAPGGEGQNSEDILEHMVTFGLPP